jgi:hypothetical protein
VHDCAAHLANGYREAERAIDFSKPLNNDLRSSLAPTLVAPSLQNGAGHWRFV